MEDQQHNVCHTPVDVPTHACPFPEQEDIFFKGLAQVEAEDILPEGFGSRPEEWDDVGYPSLKTLKTGKRQKNLTVSLPDHIWMTSSRADSLSCSTHSADGHQCQCWKYQDPDTIVPGEPVLCCECVHGKSHHDRAAASAAKGSVTSGIFQKLLHKGSDAYKKARDETNKNL